MEAVKSSSVVARLRSEILQMEGFRPGTNTRTDATLGPLLEAFPAASFPTGCMHEFIHSSVEGSVATLGFLSGLLSTLISDKDVVGWVGTSQVFAPALCRFGIRPEHVVFLKVRERDVLWTMREALSCGAFGIVVGELRALDFNNSRALQLAVERSATTGFVVQNAQKPTTTACVSRWRVGTSPSKIIVNEWGDLPGIGRPRWQVELLRIRNGRPGVWNIGWSNGRFEFDSAAVPNRGEYMKAG